MFKGLGSRAAAGAGVVGEITPPGGVRGQVTLSCSHLVYSSGHKLVESHQGVGGESWWVGVVVGGGM